MWRRWNQHYVIDKAGDGWDMRVGEEYDIVIYDKKYIFGLHPHFWHRAPKSLVYLK